MDCTHTLTEAQAAMWADGKRFAHVRDTLTRSGWVLVHELDGHLDVVTMTPEGFVGRTERGRVLLVTYEEAAADTRYTLETKDEARAILDSRADGALGDLFADLHPGYILGGELTWRPTRTAEGLRCHTVA